MSEDLEAKELTISAKEYYDIRHQLCEYHILEQKLGIDLVTFFEAMENGIFYKTGRTYCWASAKWAWCIGRDYFKIQSRKYYFKDKGKTWALKLEDFIDEIACFEN